MQQRHFNKQLYFDELAQTSKEFYIDYINQFKPLTQDLNILEIGCGEGGNMLPFAQLGCNIYGIDLCTNKITNAKRFFKEKNISAQFENINFFDLKNNDYPKFDLIIIHDVIEHILNKKDFLKHIEQFIDKNGIVFFAFPPWQMPFGGHQQICHSICSKIPFIHLLPKTIYKLILNIFGESTHCIKELLSIKECRTSIECFEKLIIKIDFKIIDRLMWFINPHYKQKFNLKPRKLYQSIGKIKYLRNFFTTSCFYIVRL